ncbi:hypothetical protein SLS62_001222 [Diatrype stigma]|uniref:2EXR domain-containing protein n=1 Tax=Diatrype stigma TaxID=117547 RepID=A0AAN9V914_9PEZI
MTPSPDHQQRVKQNDNNNNDDHQVDASHLKAKSPSSSTGLGISFGDLPPELRAMIWRCALPGPRVLDALTYVSAAGLETQVLGRDQLRMPIAHVCFESRRVVQEAGYVLAFPDADQPDDPGVWFHPQKDVVERTIWAPGDIRH